MRIASRLLVLLCVASALVAAGCKPSLEKQVVGKWAGKVELPADQVNNPMAKMFSGLLNPTLELKADKTFTMTMMIPIEGTWEVQADKVNLHITKVMGMDKAAMKQSIDQQAAKNPALAKQANVDNMDKPMILNVSADGKTMSVADPGAVAGASGKSPGDITFTKTEETK